MRSLRQAAREWVWLLDYRDGVSREDLAEREGLNEQAIQDGIDRARESETDALAHAEDPIRSLRALPVFPIGAFTPRSSCPHHGPLRGSFPPRVCMVCHQLSGEDG